jgi:hypothetical protein
MVLIGDKAQLEAHFSPFRVLILRQDQCIVCIKRTIGSEIILNAPDGTPRWVMWNLISVHLETVLILTQDRRTVCTERTVGPEIILDEPDGTPT